MKFFKEKECMTEKTKFNFMNHLPTPQPNPSRFAMVFLLFMTFLLGSVQGWGQVTWISSSTSSNSGATSSNNPTFAVPAGTSQGNLLVVAIFTEKGTGVTYTLPSGWTQIRATNDGANFGLQTFYKVAGASESGSYVFTHSTSGLWSGSISRFTGVNPSNPIGVSNGSSGSSGNATSPAITPTTAGTLILSFHGRKNTTALTADATTTQRHAYNSGNNAYSNLLSTFSGPAANTVTTAKTATGSTSNNRAAQQIAINRAVAGSTFTQTFTSNGTFTSPPCATLTVEAWGGGGGGFDGSGSGGGKGGGGGGYAKGAINNASGDYLVVVGTGGAENTNGTASTFGSTLVVADFGRGGTSATSSGGAGGTSNTGNITTSNGGNGGNGQDSGDVGGGGGGAAGPNGNGANGGNGFNDGSENIGGSGGQGNNGQGGVGGTNSNGNDGTAGTNNDLGGGGGGGGDGSKVGGNGGFPGGGGGGGENNGGVGANGSVKVTYTLPNNPTITLTNTTATACFSVLTQNATLAYSTTTGCPDNYSIDFVSGIADVIDANLSSSSITVTLPANLAAGTYNGSLTVKNGSYGFVSSTYSISVTVNQPSIAGSITTFDQTICSGSAPSTISLSGNTGTIQWQVSSNNTTFTDISGAIGTSLTNSQMGSLSATRYYRAVVTSGACSPATSSVVTVTVNPTNTAGAASSTPTLCINTTLSNITHTTTGATGIGTPTGLPAGVTAAWASNTITISGTPSVSGPFNYTIPLTGGCGTVNATGTITVSSAIPSIPGTITGTAAQCPALTGQTYSIASVAGATAYNWEVPAGWNITAGQGTASITVTTGASGQNGNVSVTANNACGASAAQTLAVTVSPATPSQPGTITGTATQCPALTGQTYNISSVTNATTYNWSVPTGWTITAGTGTNSITVTTGSSGQNGNVSVTAANSCGTSTVRILAVTVSPATPSQPGTVTGTATQCPGLTGQTYSIASVAGASSYTWTVPTGWSITAGTGTTSITVTTGTASQNGNVSVTATNSCGTSSVRTLAVTVSSTNTANAASSTPTLCINTSLTAITHTTTGASGISNSGTSGANGLPSGVFATFASNTITISGIPTASGTFNYSIPLTGGCGTVNATGTITVAALTIPTFTAVPAICSGGTLSALPTTSNNGYTGTWSPALSNTATATYTFTPTAGQCASTATLTVTVNPVPTGVTASSNDSEICLGSTTNLTSSATSNSNTAFTIITENFNGATNNWTTTNGSTNGTAANAAWTLRASGFTYDNESFITPDASQFYLSNSDAQGSSSNTATTLVSPAFSTSGMSAVNINLSHYYRFNSGTSDRARVEASTDGVNWTILYTYSSTQGAAAAFANADISLTGPFLNQSTVYIRFRYAATFDWYWAINNVIISGTLTTAPVASFAWTSSPAGYTSSTQNPTGVSPAETTTYTVTATNNYGCSATASATVTVNPTNTVSNASSTPTVCINTALTAITHSTTGATGIGTATGLPAGVSAAWASNTITISGTPTASGTFNYSIPLTGGCGTVNATGTITVTAATTYYADADGDTFGNPAVSTSACSQPSGYVTDNTDCNDSNSAINPMAVETCDGIDNDCNAGNVDGLGSTTYFRDLDGDTFGDPNSPVVSCQAPNGYVANNTDCDDNNVTYHVINTYFTDNDNDGYGDADAPDEACFITSGFSVNANDCDDTNAAVNPNASEVCNLIDDDCDGQINDGLNSTDYHLDNDGDGFGLGSAIPLCSATAGYVQNSLDCDDTNASVNPSGIEICGNVVDEDCSGVDLYPSFYVSVATVGNWNNASTWNYSCENTTFLAANYAPPASYSGDVLIAANTTVNVPKGTTTYQTGILRIEANGNLLLEGNEANNTPAVANVGPIAKLTVLNGIQNNGTLTIGHQASLLQSGATANTGNGNFVVNMNLTGNNNGAATPAPNGRYWYIGSPMSNTNAGSTFFDPTNMVRLWRYKASLNSWEVVVHSGTGATTSNTLIPGIGYLYRAGNNETVTFTGNAAVFNNNMTSNLLDPQVTGQMLQIEGYAGFTGYKYVANPYTSYIDWKLVTRSGLNVSYWIRNAQNSAYESFNATSGVSNSSTGQTTKDIPPMQGFWVYAFNTSPSLVINNGDRTHSTNVLHAPEHNQIVRLNLNDGKTDDQAVVYENENASNGIEEYDTDKFMDENHHQVYFLEGTKQVSLDGLKDATAKQKVDMGIQITGAGTYTINAVELGVEEDVVLEDKFTHTFQDLKRNSTYSFTANAGTFNNRFVLHFTLNPQTETSMESVAVTEEVTEVEGVQVYTTTGQQVKVWVTNNTDFQNATVKVYDAIGNMIERKNMTSNELLLDLNTATGVYLVEVTGDSKVFTKKIFITK